jgi:pimeloyl-ACP methyl ester carboxylesterase
MRYLVEGEEAYAAGGGRGHVAGRPWALFLHGAGFDHSVWALQSRWLAFRGWNVLAADLPGHGLTAGAPRTSVAALAQWSVALLDAVGAERASLIGHSMGSLIALETAARHAGRVERLALISAAPAMPVHRDLLAAAGANDHAAIDMVNLWSHGARAALGGSRAPGLWMSGNGERILERVGVGALHADLALCDAYRDGAAAAARVTAPTLLVSGSRDQMTPLKGAQSLAAAISGSTLVAVAGAGHMLTAERPDELRVALAAHLTRAAIDSSS